MFSNNPEIGNALWATIWVKKKNFHDGLELYKNCCRYSYSAVQVPNHVYHSISGEIRTNVLV